ncbi:MAG: nucleoside triphosphate pyrophosphohydrolase [Desulfovibrio sp.]|nr:nucleoside triphosphate pyrophosphohydrolase [Desulfovibrio sp.]
MKEKDCEALLALGETIQTLTSPQGCQWDRAQTPESLADYVIEESHELVAAIRSGNALAVREELGDVFFLLLFLAQLYGDEFSLAECLEYNRAKMIRRHPHVFAGAKFASLNEQLKAWDEIKKEERESRGIFASLPQSLPPLIKAYRIHSRAARAGFTWPDNEGVERQVEAEWLEWLDAVQEENDEAKKHELGDMLFSLVELGRRHGLKASEALDMACSRFLRRFKRMEEMADAAGLDFCKLDFAAQDELWTQVKEEEA